MFNAVHQDHEQQTKQSTTAPVQEPVGRGPSSACGLTLPGTSLTQPAAATPAGAMRLQHDSAAKPQNVVMTDGTEQAEPVRLEPDQAEPESARNKRKAVRQCHTGSAVALNRGTELGAGNDSDPPQADPDCQRADSLSAERPWPSRQAPSPGNIRAAPTPAVQGASPCSAHRQCPWPWLLDLQQRVRDPDIVLPGPGAGHAKAAGQAVAEEAEQRICGGVDGGEPLVSCIKQHATPALEDGQPAAASHAGEADQAPTAAGRRRRSPGRAGEAGGTPAAAPTGGSAHTPGRRVRKRACVGGTPAPAASPSLSLAERMRIAQADMSLQEQDGLPVPQPQLQCEGMRHSDAAASGFGKKDLYGGSSPSKSPGQSSGQGLQAKPSPWEAGVQARQAPPKFCESAHGAPLSQQPLLQRLRGKSRSPDAHPETECILDPLQRGDPPTGSGGDRGTVAAFQEPLAQRLKRKFGSLDADQHAVGQPTPGRAGRVLETFVQHLRCQGVEHMGEQHAIVDSAPGEHTDWDKQEDQLQTPHLRSAVRAAALEAQSAKSQAGQDASPELHWQRQKPCTHVLQDSSGKLPRSLEHSRRPQQPDWDDSQADSAAQCAATEPATPLTTHASSAAAAPAPEEASTGLQWRRPLARRPQNDAHVCTPGTSVYFSCVPSYLEIHQCKVAAAPVSHGYACQHCTYRLLLHSGT